MWRRVLLLVPALSAAACFEGATFSDAPVISAFVPSTNRVTKGEKISLIWEVQKASEVGITYDERDLLVTTPQLDGVIETPPVERDTVYTLTARGGGFATTKVIQVYLEDPDEVRVTAFFASPNTIDAGRPITLFWKTQRARTLSVDIVDADPLIPANIVAATSDRLNDSEIVMPTSPTVYQVTALGNGIPATAAARVRLTTGAPTVERFTADPPTLVTLGTSSRLDWAVRGANRIEIVDSKGRRYYQGDQPQGRVIVTPDRTEIYKLTAVNEITLTEATLVVNTGRELGTGPQILAFASNPVRSKVGRPVELTWYVSGAQGVEVTADGAPLTTPPALRARYIVHPLRTTVYELTARDAIDNVDRQRLTLEVDPDVPAISRFSADPSPGKLFGKTRLSWETFGADSYTIRRIAPDPRTLVEDTVTSLLGGADVTLLAERNELLLTATNAQGSVELSLIVLASRDLALPTFVQESEPNDGRTTADDSTLHGVGSVTIGGRSYPSQDEDYWAFSVPNNTALFFDARLYGTLGNPASCDGDSEIRVIFEDGREIAVDNDGGTQSCSRLYQVRLEQGRYFLVVGAHEHGALDFTYFVDVTLRQP